MSVDWDHYSTPEATRLRAKKPEKNAVIQMNVGNIRSSANLEVKHSPEATNRAHSDVFLPDDAETLTEARFILTRIAEIVIPLDN